MAESNASIEAYKLRNLKSSKVIRSLEIPVRMRSVSLPNLGMVTDMAFTVKRVFK
jgi:hypothetical protein